MSTHYAELLKALNLLHYHVKGGRIAFADPAPAKGKPRSNPKPTHKAKDDQPDSGQSAKPEDRPSAVLAIIQNQLPHLIEDLKTNEALKQAEHARSERDHALKTAARANLERDNAQRAETDLHKELDVLKITIRDKDVELDHRNKAITSLESQLRHLLDAQQAADHEKTYLQDALTDLKTQYQILDQQTEDFKAELSRLQTLLIQHAETIDGTNRQAEQARSDRAVLQMEKDALKAERAGLENKLRLQFLEQCAPLLADLSDLAGLEPEPVVGLNARSVFENTRRLLSDLGGQTLTRFPEHERNALDLNPDPDGLETLLKLYDWEPERPFDRTSERRTFQVLRRGWKIGSRVLLRARITTTKLPTDPNQEARQVDL